MNGMTLQNFPPELNEKERCGAAWFYVVRYLELSNLTSNKDTASPTS